MLYKRAAYVYLVASTITLLLTNSEAELLIEPAKVEVTGILSRFIRTALQHKSEDLNGLINTANELWSRTPLEIYLKSAAKDNENIFKRIAKAINVYERKFRQILGQIREGLPEEKRIPIFKELNNFRKWYYIEHGTNPQGEASSSTLRQLSEQESDEDGNKPKSASILRRLFEQESDEDADDNAIDQIGFEIKKGIHQVKLLLDKLIKLALIKCKDLKTLTDFADSMINCTSLHKYVVEAVENSQEPELREKIKRYIREYKTAIGILLNESREPDVNCKLTPMLDKLENINQKCGPDPVESTLD